MTPLERVLARLPNPRPCGNGYEDRCPAHRDTKPSLRIGTGKDGRVLLHCHARCKTADVLRALGLTFRDLFPGNSSRPYLDSACRAPAPLDRSLLASPAAERAPKIYPTPEAAARAYRRAQPDYVWIYRWADGTEMARLYRWNEYLNKVVRPVTPVPNGWIRKGPDGPTCLYRLQDILAAPEATVWLCEGEKCADRVTSLGFLGTTVWGGANRARSADFAPLAGRQVVIVPDNDTAGHGYAQDCARLLGPMAAGLAVVPHWLFPPGKDIADLNDADAISALRAKTEDLSIIPDPATRSLEQILENRPEEGR